MSWFKEEISPEGRGSTLAGVQNFPAFRVRSNMQNMWKNVYVMD